MLQTVEINYELAKENNVAKDAERAMQILLAGEAGDLVTIYPQALNPLLKALESIGMWKHVMVIPGPDASNRPIYTVVKLGKGVIDQFSTNEKSE